MVGATTEPTGVLDLACREVTEAPWRLCSSSQPISSALQIDGTLQIARCVSVMATVPARKPRSYAINRVFI